MSKKRENKEKRLVYIRNLMETTGSSKVNASEIARVFNVSETVIRGDLKEIYREMNEKSKEAVGVELVKIDAGLRRGMRELEKIIESEKPAEQKVKAIETYSKMASDYIAGKSRLGIFRDDGKQDNQYPIICFTHGVLEDDNFVAYCKRLGHNEVEQWYADFQKELADKAAKEALEREQRLHPQKDIQMNKEIFLVDDASDMKVAVDKFGLSVGALREEMKKDKWGCSENEYYCFLCETCHLRGSICWTKIKSGKGHRIDPGDFSASD